MKPNDKNGYLESDKRPFRILIISGSDRRQYNCPGVDSKSRTLMMRMAEHLPQDWEIDFEDLGNVYGRPQIQSCNGVPRRDSSPMVQQRLGLNRDVTLFPKKGEGKKLREG